MGDFKVKFRMLDYKQSLNIKENITYYLDHDEVINERDCDKGNIDKCIWKRHEFSDAEVKSPFIREREATRILKTGVYIGIKDEILWIPPSYYFALQYGTAGDDPVQFRLKRLKHVLFKIIARNNPRCKGTYTVKNRQDGETTMAMTDGLWECADGGEMYNGQIGLQSKTRPDAINPCWFTLQSVWQNIPQWVKDILFSDFVSGENIETKFKFSRPSNAELDLKARNIIYSYFPAVYNAMDGKNNMRICILDEVLKWLECLFGDTLVNYTKFIMPGFERRGLFNIFSSPADKDCQSYRDGFEIWKSSDPDKIDPETGTTESGLHRYYSNPLEGIQGAYDKWGDADPDMIYAHIMRTRKSTQKSKLLGEIRGYPLSEEEMWGSLEASSVWSNTEGIKARKIYLIGTRYKNAVTKEPTVVYGNLERIEGYIDGDVEFRQADADHFDLKSARFCFSYLPQNKEPLKTIFKPPKIVSNVVGLDPFNLRYPAKNIYQQSDAAMVNRKFRDFFDTGINKCPTMIYCCRPNHQEIMFEDALKAAIFNRALLQYENRNDKFGNYAEDRGYHAWLLPEIGANWDSKRKGDAPSGKGKFLDEGMALLDAATNVPIIKGDPYHLEKYWFIELLSDYLKFNQFETHANNLTMADLQALIGVVKIMHRKIHQTSDLTAGTMDYLLN